MKTIRTMLKNFKRKKPPIPIRDGPEDTSGSDTLPKEEEKAKNHNENHKSENDIKDNHENNKNRDENERKTDEIPGDPRVDSPDDRENSESLQERGEVTLEEAYRRGVIDGRNQQIEERYFPKVEDGIPHFHGRPSESLPSSSIFSMAREA